MKFETNKRSTMYENKEGNCVTLIKFHLLHKRGKKKFQVFFQFGPVVS